MAALEFKSAVGMIPQSGLCFIPLDITRIKLHISFLDNDEFPRQGSLDRMLNIFMTYLWLHSDITYGFCASKMSNSMISNVSRRIIAFKALK